MKNQKNNNIDQNLNKCVGDLRKNPMFNMSLSSKELFHSNFLAWLVENYPKEFDMVFSEILDGNNIKIPSILIEEGLGKVERERRNKDLTIYLEDNKKIIIENKVKSLPDIKQLESYSEENTYHILLSLYEPDWNMNSDNSFFIKNAKNQNHKWHYVSYNVLLGKLKDLNINSKHKVYLEDYVSFISLLSELSLNIVNIKLDDEFEPLKYYELFKEIRLHDLYQKIYFSKLNELLKKKNDEINFEDSKSFIFSTDLQSQSGRISIILNSEYRDNIDLEINVHNDKLILLLSDMNKSDFLKNTQSYELINEYFSILDKYSSDGIIYPTKPNEYCNTNQYFNIYRYRKTRINNKTIGEVLDIVIDGMNHIMKYKEDIFDEHRKYMKGLNKK